MPPWQSLVHGKVKIDIDPSMAGRLEVIFEFGCGTATGCTLYYLLHYPRSICICIDRDVDKEFVLSHLPPEVHNRVFFESEDVGELTLEKLEAFARKYAKAGLERVTRAHWSPCCRPNSEASRGYHRDMLGNPRTDFAALTDKIFEKGCQLLRQLTRRCTRICITVENPVSATFPHLTGVRKLLRDPRWRLLAGSHCSNLCSADTGDWPQKDTYWLTFGVVRKFHLDLCDFDCKMLIDGTDRHKVVLCSGSSVLPDQHVIRDPYMKGLLPLGVF